MRTPHLSDLIIMLLFVSEFIAYVVGKGVRGDFILDFFVSQIYLWL
jgi:hypothetical protein